MYLVYIAIFALGIAALGTSIFMFFVRMEKKRAIVIGVVGVILIIGTISANKLRPSFEKDISITVKEVTVTAKEDSDGNYSCKVTDTYELFHYFNRDKGTVEEFCSQFNKDETYNITYRFKSGVNTILEVH